MRSGVIAAVPMSRCRDDDGYADTLGLTVGLCRMMSAPWRAADAAEAARLLRGS
jgi:hypothetical protein